MFPISESQQNNGHSQKENHSNISSSLAPTRRRDKVLNLQEIQSVQGYQKLANKDLHLEKNTSDRAKLDAKRSGLLWDEHTSHAIILREINQEIEKTTIGLPSRHSEAHL
ncbi:hypothetical protein Mapa_000479 [Marchantia paleacea]|nr:hypothetical protein Mapa_000479 [Marchantia paleacea]